MQTEQARRHCGYEIVCRTPPCSPWGVEVSEVQKGSRVLLSQLSSHMSAMHTGLKYIRVGIRMRWSPVPLTRRAPLITLLFLPCAENLYECLKSR